jgi:excisionase family DNA binding protein
MNTTAEMTHKQLLAADGFATIEDATQFLRLKRSSIYNLMNSGHLRFAKFGKSRRISWRSLRELAEQSLVGTGEAG